MAKEKAEAKQKETASLSSLIQTAEEQLQPVNKNKRFRKDKRECHLEEERELTT